MTKTDKHIDKETGMLKVTPAGSKAMTDFFKDKDKSPVRISLAVGGCGIRFLNVSPNAGKKSDLRYSIGNFTYLIDKKVLAAYGPISVDSDGFSFRLSGCGITPPDGCGTCAFGCTVRGQMQCSGDCISCTAPCSTGRILRNRRQRRASLGY